MKISMFSTHEMKDIWYLLKKSKFSFYFILFFEDLQLINLLIIIQAESQYNVKKDKGVDLFVTEYLDQST